MEDKESPMVIIVGAGAAGIAVATRLLRNNFSRFIILEAQDRIGGRVFSKKFGNGMVDLGAQWCHGEEGNIVYELIKDHNVLKHDSSQFLPFQLQYSQTDFKQVNESINAELTELYFQIHKEAYDTVEVTSIGDYFSKHYVEVVETKYHDNLPLKKFALDAEGFFLHMAASLEGTLSVYDASANCSYEECEGDQMLSWNGKGFRTILDVLMNKFPNPEKSLPIDDKIFFDKEVENIQWKNDNKRNSPIVVKCTDGTVYNSQYVVMTASIGVQKEKMDELYTPSLPIDKRRAIEDIGFGAIMKVFLEYKERWWPNDFKGCGFVWSKKDRELLRNKGDEWIMDIFYLFILDSNPNVLCFFISHENVPSIEQKTDDEIISGISFLLEKFLAHKYTPTAPCEILRSTWYSNPYFRGTYSYQSLKSQQHKTPINETLAAPLCNYDKPVVLFAGEATHSTYYGTVHAAIETGFREADRLLTLMKQLK